MVKFSIKKYIGAIALGALTLCVPSCSDTWDDHYTDQTPGGTVANKTLWEQITSNPKLKKFATIAEKNKFWKDEKHPVGTYTFADILKSGQVNTVWAPEDDAISDEEYNRLLALTETDGYNVQQQFLGNHVALWRHSLNSTGIDTLTMINKKKLEFDRDNKTLKGQMIGSSNIPASNGILHTIKGIAPFDYNLYEYIKYQSAQDMFKQYVVARDTTYFNRDASIEGMPDEDGNPTYVDSVYYTSNRLLSGAGIYRFPEIEDEKVLMYERLFSARIGVEDSVFVMLLPTDKAWEEMTTRLAPFYKYAPKYEDKDKGNQGTSATIEVEDPDSIQKFSSEMDVIASLVFNVNKQPKVKGETSNIPYTLETFMETKGKDAEYLLNTAYDTIRNTPTWEKSTLFDGKPILLSNGYGVEVDKWNYPVEFYKPDVEVEPRQFYYTSNSSYYKAGGGTGTMSFSSTVFDSITSKYGKCFRDDYFLLVNPGASSGGLVEIPLRGNSADAYVPNATVMSGKYDVQIIMVPYWYKTIADAGVIDSVYYDPVKVDSIAELNKNKFRVRLRYNDGGNKDKTSSWVNMEYNAAKVDTLTVIEDFEFPYSYQNLRKTYPTIIIESNARSSDLRKGYILPLCIDKIILKSKETNETIM